MAAPLMIAAGATQAIGSLVQGQMTSSALNAQATLQQQNANEAEAQGQYEATKQSIIAGQKIGAIKANYGASGVASNSGSALDVIGASAANAELDRQNILHGADVKAINYLNQATMDKYGAQSTLSGSYMSALGGLAKAGLGAVAQTKSAYPMQPGAITPMEDVMGGGTGSGNYGLNYAMPQESVGQ